MHLILTRSFLYVKLSTLLTPLLLQKNPSAIRTPEDDKGQELQQLDLLVNLDKSQVISPVIYDMCRDAKETTFTKEADLTLLSKCM